MNADKMVAWAQAAVDFFKDFHAKNSGLIDGFAAFPSNHLSLVRKDGALDFYHGVLRAVDADGKEDPRRRRLRGLPRPHRRGGPVLELHEVPLSCASLGKEDGWYRVGPLARLNTCDFIPTPLAQKEFEIYQATRRASRTTCRSTRTGRG